MWFDVSAALAEIEAGRISAPEARAPATSAIKPSHVANVASVAAPETFPQGVSVAVSPLTWTGRVVSLDEWRRLSEWQRHGPNGRRWCGIASGWIDPKGE